MQTRMHTEALVRTTASFFLLEAGGSRGRKLARELLLSQCGRLEMREALAVRWFGQVLRVHFDKGCQDVNFLPTNGFSVLNHLAGEQKAAEFRWVCVFWELPFAGWLKGTPEGKLPFFGFSGLTRARICPRGLNPVS